MGKVLEQTASALFRILSRDMLSTFSRVLGSTEIPSVFSTRAGDPAQQNVGAFV